MKDRWVRGPAARGPSAMGSFFVVRDPQFVPPFFGPRRTDNGSRFLPRGSDFLRVAEGSAGCSPTGC